MIGTNQQWKQTFIFDRYGNRTFDTANNNTTTLANGCPVNICNPTANPQDNKLVGTNYDSVGNTKIDANGQTFTYDAENKQTKVINAQGVTLGEYFYDGDGKRIKKIAPLTNETTIFVYDAGGKMVAEYSTVTASQSEAKISYLTNDHLGSPRITTDATGKVVSRRDFLPFGEEIARAENGMDSVRQKFTGYERDGETELDFAQARMYNKNHGRFTSPDDFLNDTKVIEPDSWNLYGYVRNNPLKNIDPSGEEVDGTDLNEAQRKQLVDDWKKKTGYKNVYFDKKTNKLVVDTASGFKKGSATARTELLAAATSTSKIFNLKATNDSASVAFAQNVGTGVTKDGSGAIIQETYDVNIDFNDFKQLKGDKAAKQAFSIGIALIHEFEHGLHERETTGSDSPNSPTDPGPLERTYINPIRSELGLAQRSTYSGVLQSTGKNTGLVELKFKDTNGKSKILRWQDSVIGGKRK